MRYFLDGNWYQNRAIGEASEAQIKSAMGATDEIVEWPLWNLTWTLSKKAMTIVRAGMLGGDTRVIHGGFVYANTIALQLDWLEIKRVPESMRVFANE